MPVYSFYCPRHVEERTYSMASVPKWIKCSCGKRAKLGIPSRLTEMFVENKVVSDKTKQLFRYVFGKKKAAKIRTTRDIDANFQDFARRFPHLQPGYKRGKTYDLHSASDIKNLGTPIDTCRDPFPDTPITDERRNNPERRII